MNPWIALPCIFLLLGLEGFCSGVELGLLSTNRFWLMKLKEGGHRGARIALTLLAHPERLFATTLVGTNLAVVSQITLITFLITEFFGRSFAPMAIVWTITGLVFGEVIPKSLFQSNADRWIPRASWGLGFLYLILLPITIPFARLARLLAGGSGQWSGREPYVTRDELLLFTTRPSERGRGLEAEMLKKCLGFSKVQARHAMSPLVEVKTVGREVTVGEARRIFSQERFSRLPVYEGNAANIVGIVSVRTLMFVADPDDAVSNFVEDVPFVPETMPLSAVLATIVRKKKELAVVVNEFGGAVGIVTAEDIYEEIVGEIHDEYDVAMPLVESVAPGIWRIDARMEIDRINEELKLDLPRGPYETLGGFLLAHFGRIPEMGERLQIGTYHFVIEKASKKAIEEIRVQRV